MSQKITVTLTIEDAEHVEIALAEYANRLRNAKSRPQGVTIGDLLDRVMACTIVGDKVTNALAEHRAITAAQANEPRPSRGDV